MSDKISTHYQNYFSQKAIPNNPFRTLPFVPIFPFCNNYSLQNI